MTFTVNKLQEFLNTELGFDSQQITTRNFHSWNRFYADNDFIYLKPIKDRSPEGMMLRQLGCPSLPGTLCSRPFRTMGEETPRRRRRHP